MATLDWVVIASYSAILLGLAWWVIRRGRDTDYFLASRNLGWFVVGASTPARPSISWYGDV